MTAYVTAHDIAAQLGRHPSTIVRDLKTRGYATARKRAPSGQTMVVLTKPDAERYVAERRSEML